MNDKKNLFIQIVKGILVFLLFRFSVYLQYIPIYLFKIDVRHITASMNVLLSCFSNILLVIMLWFILATSFSLKDSKNLKRILTQNWIYFVVHFGYGWGYIVGISKILFHRPFVAQSNR